MPCRLSVGSVRNQVGNVVQILHKHFSAFAVTMCDVLTVQVTVCKLSPLLSTHIHGLSRNILLVLYLLFMSLYLFFSYRAT